ncbi:MAG: hypothetical protein R3304_12310, partial [Longimicrobiales bacterium]|nr:hypothetical protein [Longimicrobiales bacterium]
SSSSAIWTKRSSPRTRRREMTNGGGLLEREGLFLPEEHHGAIDLERSGGGGSLLLVGGGLCGACVLMIVGQGGLLTWIGAGVSMVLFVVVAWVAGRSIDAQNARVDELLGR